MHKSRARIYIWRLIFLSVLILPCAFYNGLTIRVYKQQTDKLIAGSTVRIVLVTDLHSTIYGKDQQPLIQKIIRQQPDLILLAGDIADDETPIAGTELFLAGIQGLAPIYYVTGNHEYWSGDVKTICRVIQSYGVTILSDSCEPLTINGNRLVIAGTEDPDKTRYGWPGYNPKNAMDKAFAALHQTNAYRILLAHRPERIKQYSQYPFDLVVSGHTHGGQLRIPFLLNGLYAPNQGWFPPYAGGLYRHGTLTHIVSRGLSFNARMPRVFNPPEIVVIDLEGDTDTNRPDATPRR